MLKEDRFLSQKQSIFITYGPASSMRIILLVLCDREGPRQMTQLILAEEPTSSMLGVNLSILHFKLVHYPYYTDEYINFLFTLAGDTSSIL